ncbi:MAG: penicillin-binding protein 2 [Alphaproteobacteria bacterium]|nr:penicillin-binding protein 2 [Alphaproteobacteria bacterium]
MSPQHKDMRSVENVLSTQLKQIRLRLLVLIVAFMSVFMIIQIRLVDIMMLQSDRLGNAGQTYAMEGADRGKILDAHGNVIATTLITASLYGNPKMILDPMDAAKKLVATFPDLNIDVVYKKLTAEKGFVWLKRNLSPQDQQRVIELGLPGLDFQFEKKRIYPQGNLFSHILGVTDIDGNGTAGVEKQFDHILKDPNKEVQLSLSLPIQHILHNELKQSVEKFKAKGGSGMVISLKTGQILGMVSAPDFDPNNPKTMGGDNAFNRNTLGVYEQGSVMKLLNTAMFLKYGKGGVHAVFDASQPLALGKFRIKDYRGGERRPLTVEEIFFHSSNIGSALMALSIGPEKQMDFLREVGLCDKPSIELPEKGRPLLPSKPSRGSCMTIAFGHGLAASPIQFMQSITNVLTEHHLPLSLLKNPDRPQSTEGELIAGKDRKTLCGLMLKTLEDGTARKAKVQGYLIGGKTGTAEKVEKGRYLKDGRNLASFFGVFPLDNPEYLVFVSLDEPQAIQGTYGFTAAGWNAAPLGGRIITRIAPMLGVEPRFE